LGDLKKLRNLLVGNEVISVERSKRSEHIAKIQVRIKGQIHEFEIGATDLGWWIEGAKNLTAPEKVYENVEKAFLDIKEYLTTNFGDNVSSDFEFKEKGNFFYFQTKPNLWSDDQTFCISKKAISASPWAKQFQDLKSREDLVYYLCLEKDLPDKDVEDSSGDLNE
jgi:hypothetical protein